MYNASKYCVKPKPNVWWTVKANLVEKDKPIYLYGPRMAIDDNLRTSWCEGRIDNGIGGLNLPCVPIPVPSNH